MNISKISNIIFIAIFIFLVLLFCVNTVDLIQSSKNIQNIKDSLISQGISDANEEDNFNLNEPINEDLIGETTENVGARDDKNNISYNLTIINLEDLSRYIPTDGNMLLEVYSSTYAQIKSMLNGDTYAYIDETSITYKSYILSFTLLDASSNKKIGDIKITLPTTDLDLPTSVQDFKIDNLTILKEKCSLNGEGILYAYDKIKSAVYGIDKNISSCLIDEKTISVSDNIVSFDIVDASKKSKITNIKLSF